VLGAGLGFPVESEDWRDGAGSFTLGEHGRRQHGLTAESPLVPGKELGPLVVDFSTVGLTTRGMTRGDHWSRKEGAAL
jgi:hypothetical protein